MKTSNSVLCTVVVAVLGLSVVLSAPQALAQETQEFDYQVYPGDTCVKLPGAQIVRNELGGIANFNTAANLFVSCPLPNNVGYPGPEFVILFAFIYGTDRNPGPTSVDEINCTLIQSMRIFENSGHVFRFSSGRSGPGASENLALISLPGPDPGNITTGGFSTNFLKCLIPRQTSNNAFSELHYYSVVERRAVTSGGMSQAMLPPGVQERAAVQAQEMRVTQALTTEKEDPEWSQRAVTSWTQVLQKEDLKGVQLNNIECRMTLCRLQLTLTAPPQGDAVFGQDFTKLILLAPWPVQGFGKIANPGGQAPAAVLYIAREGHSLP